MSKSFQGLSLIKKRYWKMIVISKYSCVIFLSVPLIRTCKQRKRERTRRTTHTHIYITHTTSTRILVWCFNSRMIRTLNANLLIFWFHYTCSIYVKHAKINTEYVLLLFYFHIFRVLIVINFDKFLVFHAPCYAIWLCVRFVTV